MKGYEILLNELRKIKGGWKVKDLMTSEVRTIEPHAKMSQAISDMKKYRIHGLVVTEGKTPAGIVTTYDALLVMARGENGERIEVRDMMSRSLVYVHPDDDIVDALEKMLDNQLTKLPVVKDGNLAGILSASDLIDAFDQGIFEKQDMGEKRKARLSMRDLMHEPIILSPDETVCKAAKLMTEKGRGSVLVRKDEGLGIVTEKDIFKKIVAKGLDGTTIAVSEIMNAPCITIDAEAGMTEASELFKKHNIRRLPVVENEKVVGVVSVEDVAKTMTLRRNL